MRQTRFFNDNWNFTKENIDPRQTDSFAGEAVTLPHTWNAEDGQDGGNDYYRGKCWYLKRFAKPDLLPGEEAWLEFGAVAMSAEVFLNGRLLGAHQGGYSCFRVNLTSALEEDNLLVVSADNSPCRNVYPQKADFTFYGGIYRDVRLIILPKSHFALGYYGGSGIRAVPKLEGDAAHVTLEAWTENVSDGALVDFSIEGVGAVQAEVQNGHAAACIDISPVRRWDGANDPHLYTAAAELAGGADKIETCFGCREFSVDPEKGFFLNGRSYPLCGAARHQDRAGAGYAITQQMQQEDMALMLEMGINTVRLAHYQHDQYFYDLCDKVGLVAWAEIPYISEHMPEANDNTVSQMTELVAQNVNHPSIVCWGLSNEITAACDITEDLMENHRRLNDLCHSLDPTRLTTMAHVFMLPTDHPLVQLPDIRSYNLYYGWYLGELEDNDCWFDDFHRQFPELVIGLSEYGADANPQYQTSSPERGDYTETYQALYHEHMLKMWSERPYIWAMHVWNMFDFAADGRDEGGKHGINQKGLVTFDRKIKKDAFYIYKAYLSKVPFVHICGRRYADRAEETTEIKVYSNQSRVTLLVDGKEFETRSGDRVFVFKAPISGEHLIEAKAGNCSDSIQIRKVEQPNPDYIMSGGQIINWFNKTEMEIREGYYSLKDTLGDIKKSPAGAALLEAVTQKATAARGDVAQGVQMPEAMQQMLDRMTLEKMLKQIGDVVSAEDAAQLNQALSQIPKEQPYE